MNKLKKNFAYATAYKMLELLLPIITSPLLSRRLGAEMLGVYTYTYSISSLFIMVAELGCYRYGMREIAKIRNDVKALNQCYSDIFCTHAANGMVVYLAYLLFAVLCGGQYRVIFLIQGLGILSNMIDNSFLYIGLEELKTVTYRDAAVKLLSFILIVCVIKQPGDLLNYVIIMNVCSFVCKLVALIYSRKYVHFVHPLLKNCKQHYKCMFRLMIPVVSAGIYQSMDKMMIGSLYNKSDVGYYECASKALLPKNIITVFGTVLCPHITNLYAQSKKREAEEKFIQSLQLSLVMAYAFMFGIAAVAKEFAPLFWGRDFAVCANLMIGLSISIPLWTVGEVIRNQYLLPNSRDNEYTISFIVGVVVNVLLNLVLIGHYGAMGAIVATIAAEFAMSAAQMFFIRREINLWRGIAGTMPYFFFGVLMMAAVRVTASYCTAGGIIQLLTEIMAGVILFIILCLGYEKVANKPLLLMVIAKKKNK